mmetsp:Transcript_17908/g.26568  ORF Transcript_17908/g.26568 Transcript_17908/m.26568 type:complete len:129 (-) Transcript_17908:47-433(-)|eukprot:CAMPEP_0194026978 /NCGR_PEP_ID=MMETSP0009_2-20130614/1218_1 /TAXON_ID=210454 /ORGANISM="Grammatophora oceanica, Strain CCMP 410" /LENGTH=128 /DNA_ID=CAMNT_0038665889 /DNA_START=259 /DNA_END=645 /DNA_ORIENTATION=-
MRLLTHNYLKSNVKGTENGYPLVIEAEEVVVVESPVDATLLAKLLPKLDYACLLGAAKQLEDKTEVPTLPTEAPNTKTEPLDEDVMANLHKVLFDIHINEGFLVCPDTGRRFPIKEGIPNMILHEDEV